MNNVLLTIPCEKDGSSKSLCNLSCPIQVEYQLEFAEWLASCTGQLKAGAADTAPPCPEQLLLQAVSALEHMQPAGSLQGVRSGMSTASVSRGLPTTADRTVPVTAAAAGAGRHARASMDAWGGPSPVSSGRRLEQLLRVQVMLSQVRRYVPCIGRTAVALSQHSWPAQFPCPITTSVHVPTISN